MLTTAPLPHYRYTDYLLHYSSVRCVKVFAELLLLSYWNCGLLITLMSLLQALLQLLTLHIPYN